MGGRLGDEVSQFLGIGGLVERFHREAMGHLDRARRRVSTHTLQLRMVGSESLQLVPHFVEFSVGYLGSGLVVVKMRMVGDPLCQRLDARLSSGSILLACAHRSAMGATPEKSIFSP